MRRSVVMVWSVMWLFGVVACDDGTANVAVADVGGATPDTGAETLDAEPTVDTPAGVSDVPEGDATSGDTTATCPGAPGCSCDQAADCADGLCIDTAAGKRCAAACAGACDDGYACRALTATDRAPKDVCVPAHGKLCQPCKATKDCEAAGIEGALCVDEGTLGRFCGSPCATAADCPGGYGCLVSQSPEGPKSLQCVKLPADGSGQEYGTCSCWDASKSAGASTQCFAVQRDLDDKVVGKCPGTRTCAPTGLGECILVAPKAEVCDGVDNDCNGLVDDEPGGCGQDETCQAGKCVPGSCSAVEGGWTDWTWEPCSGVCGEGTRLGTRTCTAPAPACGGAECVGDDAQIESCSLPACGGDTLGAGTHVYADGCELVEGVVPSGVSSVTVSLWGGGGAGGYPGNGGGGAFVKATVATAPGDALVLRVACGGEQEGGGGGASSFWLNGQLMMIAGGGGGAGSDGCSGCYGSALDGAGGGGGAAGLVAQAGTANNALKTNSGGGEGGDQVHGGAGGLQTNASAFSGCTVAGASGAAFTGGGCAGGFLCTIGPYASEASGGLKCTGNGNGGAGGAGYFGGGSGAGMYTYSGGGGGGGSSWVSPGATAPSSQGGSYQVAGGTGEPSYKAPAGQGGLGRQSPGSDKPEDGHPGQAILTLQ